MPPHGVANDDTYIVFCFTSLLWPLEKCLVWPTTVLSIGTATLATINFPKPSTIALPLICQPLLPGPATLAVVVETFAVDSHILNHLLPKM